MPNGTLSLSKEQWISVLKLSHMWFFRRVRTLAIRKLQDLDPVRKIQLSASCEVSEWVRPAYLAIINRQDTLSQEECDMLGSQRAMVIMRVRENSLRQVLRTNYSSWTFDESAVVNLLTDEGIEM